MSLYIDRPKRLPTESKEWGKCAKCRKDKWLTTHHLFPKRFFKGQTKLRQKRVKVCRDCHDQAELMLEGPKRSIEFYENAWHSFLSN